MISSADLFICCFLTLLVIYGYFVCSAIIGLLSDDPEKNKNNSEFAATIIVPFRNEDSELKALESQLIKLCAGPEYAIIFVNDSTNGYIPTESNNRIVLSNSGSGKKDALKTGVEVAKTDTIVFFDADVQLTASLFKNIKSYWNGSGMLLLPVVQTGSGWKRVFSVESSMLAGISCGLANTNNPVMANGAGLVVSKTEWLESFPAIQKEYISGDDIFIMLDFKRRGLPVRSIINRGTLISTRLPLTYRSLIKQRVRWAGKSVGIRDSSTIAFGLSTFMMYCLLILAFVVPINFSHIIMLSVAVLIKAIVEYILLVQFNKRTDADKSLLSFFLLQLIYPIYAILIPLIGLVYKPEWKGRRAI